MGATPRPAYRDFPRQWWDTLVGDRHDARESREHLDAAMSWLCDAQDAGDDDGVARMFHVRNGWGASYPETTGYIIPTFLRFAAVADDPAFAERAMRMASWESDIQMSNGAVQGGVVSDDPTPAIFNTGQVIFGWCAAHAHSPDERFERSARSAARYLVDNLDDDGAWRRNLSDYCDSPDDTYAFNVRSAWAMIIAARLFNDDPVADAARANVNFVVSLAQTNGWIAKNCLNRPEQPLLHTISYAYQGLLESGLLLDDEAAVQLAINGNEALLDRFREHGRLHGRYADDWVPTVRWRCLTGEAQTAIVWYRLHDVTGDERWRQAADQLLTLLKRTQSLTGRNGVAGGVKGSQPITAPYGRMTYLNWAAKFFADALMLNMNVPGSSRDG